MRHGPRVRPGSPRTHDEHALLQLEVGTVVLGERVPVLQRQQLRQVHARHRLPASSDGCASSRGVTARPWTVVAITSPWVPAWRSVIIVADDVVEAHLDHQLVLDGARVDVLGQRSASAGAATAASISSPIASITSGGRRREAAHHRLSRERPLVRIDRRDFGQVADSRTRSMRLITSAVGGGMMAWRSRGGPAGPFARHHVRRVRTAATSSLLQGRIRQDASILTTSVFAADRCRPRGSARGRRSRGRGSRTSACLSDKGAGDCENCTVCGFSRSSHRHATAT